VGEKKGPFTADAFATSTKPLAVIQPIDEAIGSDFYVKSKVAVTAPPNGVCQFNIVDFEGSTKSTKKAKCEVLTGPANIGWIRVILDDPLTLSQVRLQVSNINNIFGDAIRTDNTLLALAAVPKDKTDSMAYLKFSHQAGAGYPGWIVDTKLAPLVGQSFWNGWRARPSILVDIGNRAVGTAKTNDVIKPSFAITRLIRRSDTLEAIRLTPGISYETNRKGTTGNLLADVDVQFMIKGLYNPLAHEQFRMWNAAHQKAVAAKAAGNTSIQDPKLEEFTPIWGWGFQFFLGTEVGGALNERMVQASKGTAGAEAYEIELPKFTVARLRPKARFFVEYRRLKLDTTFTPRYLFTHEAYSFESKDSKQVYLGDLHGWASYIESSLSVQLDAAGHIALSSTWKQGVMPPAYVRVNTFQTGVEFKY
jgi:hypothetical protein